MIGSASTESPVPTISPLAWRCLVDHDGAIWWCSDHPFKLIQTSILREIPNNLVTLFSILLNWCIFGLRRRKRWRQTLDSVSQVRSLSIFVLFREQFSVGRKNRKSASYAHLILTPEPYPTLGEVTEIFAIGMLFKQLLNSSKLSHDIRWS